MMNIAISEDRGHAPGYCWSLLMIGISYPNTVLTLPTPGDIELASYFFMTLRCCERIVRQGVHGKMAASDEIEQFLNLFRRMGLYIKFNLSRMYKVVTILIFPRLKSHSLGACDLRFGESYIISNKALFGIIVPRVVRARIAQ